MDVNVKKETPIKNESFADGGMNVIPKTPVNEERTCDLKMEDHIIIMKEDEKKLAQLLKKWKRVYNGPYTCELCHQSFANKPDLLNHLKTHAQQRQFGCIICDKKLSTKRDFHAHMREIHDGFACNFCGLVFEKRERLHRHLRVHTDFKAYECDICLKRFKCKWSMQKHLQAVHELVDKFACDRCGRTFNCKEYLTNHLLIHSDNRVHPCEICGKLFKCRKSLWKHVRSHSKEHRCKYCDDTFADRELLREHLAVHKVEEKHVCEFCNKVFRSENGLQQHVRLKHVVKEETLFCTYCRKRFPDSDIFYEHKITMHKDVYMCQFCGKIFNTKKIRQGHVRKMHRELTCSFCSLSFLTFDAFKEHLLLDRRCLQAFEANDGFIFKEKHLFKCEECGLGFSNKKVYRIHIQVHEGLRQHVCMLCDKVYRHKSGLFGHLRLKHKGTAANIDNNQYNSAKDIKVG